MLPPLPEISLLRPGSDGTELLSDCVSDSASLEDKYDLERFSHDYFEYESGQKSIIVKGRLKKHLAFWKTIGANDFILDVIENGYKIPLYSNPRKTFCKNNKSAIENSDFVTEAIQDLLDRHLILKCKEQPYIVNPLTVSVQSNSKKRLILDLRVVNKHLWKMPIKYDDIKVVLDYLQNDFFMVKFDLTSAYHFVDIYLPHTEYLGFSWFQCLFSEPDMFSFQTPRNL